MHKILFTLILGFTVGCGRGDSNSVDAPKPGDGGGGGGDGAATATTVKAIRMTQPTTGAMVSLSNVVVVTHVSSTKSGSIYVQDAGGGMYSGIKVFCNYGSTPPKCAMTRAQIDALAVGTVVNLTGAFNSFLLSTAPTGAQPVFEIENPTITATGAMMTPVAVDVAASVIAKAQLASPAADPYKGTYVHVTGAASYTVSSVMAPEFMSTCTGMGSPGASGTTYNGFEATGGGQTLAIGLNFYHTLTYCLPCSAAMPYPCANPVTNQAFSSVRGIPEPDYNGTAVFMRLSPVVDADLTHP
ncbi:MAG: hypothetical protein JWO36_354 [Myxococcales bacterium]|nr:hypothetical protein [Myxococcales bacterium]